MNRKTLIKKAIRQTDKMIELIEPNNRKCLVCRYFNKGKISFDNDYCRSPYSSCEGCITEMCKEYAMIMNDCVGKLDTHLNKLWEMLENE